jgi:hypothetical protein
LVDQEKVMLRSTSKQWHVVSPLCAAIMPSFRRLGGYADEQNPGNG